MLTSDFFYFFLLFSPLIFSFSSFPPQAHLSIPPSTDPSINNQPIYHINQPIRHHHSLPRLQPLTSLSYSSLFPQEHSDSPSPTSASTFYYPLNSKPQYPESSEGAEPHAGQSPPGQLLGPPPVAAEWNPACYDAAAYSALPPVAAGDTAVLQVTEVGKLCDGCEGSPNTEEPDCQITLMWQ